MSDFAMASAGAARRCARPGKRPSAPTDANIPKPPTKSRSCCPRELPKDWDADLPIFPADEKGVATREASGKVLNAIAARVPWLIGGAGDLAPSTKTKLSFDGAGTLAPRRNRAAAICISASASTPWEPS